MKPGLKRGLKIAAAVILVLIAIPVVLIGSAFIGRSDIVDGAEPDPAVRVVKDGIVSLGVVDAGNGKVALIDAGNDVEGKAVLAELARRQLGPDAVEAIFLTHGHADHFNGVHLFPKAAVYILAADIPLAEGREGGHGPLTKLFPVKPTGLKITRGLADGETVTVGSRTIRVFAVPGHTAGSAAYLVNGVLFLGDSAGANKDGKIMGAPWVVTDDSAQNHASLHALAERLKPNAAEVKALVPAHCGVLKGLDPLIAFQP
jgi:glyoxylase-like metal-dependent hydrolase (beta-lactamase superfamily II)